MGSDLSVTRELSLIEFDQHPPQERSGARHWLARSQNFSVEWIEARRGPASVAIVSEYETLVLLFGAAARIEAGAATVTARPRSVCILPAGAGAIELASGGQCVVLASQRSDIDAATAINASHFRTPDARIAPPTPAYRRRTDPGAIVVIDIDTIKAPADNPRLKMLQSATLSINWVEYVGARDRRALSPHSHADLEQGSLALAGRFVHHLREPWGRDADLWRDDRHLTVGSPSLLVVPVNMIHTSEGIEAGPHLLIDVFAPPRRDFIAKGWVANASDYEAP